MYDAEEMRKLRKSILGPTLIGQQLNQVIAPNNQIASLKSSPGLNALETAMKSLGLTATSQSIIEQAQAVAPSSGVRDTLDNLSFAKMAAGILEMQNAVGNAMNLVVPPTFASFDFFESLPNLGPTLSTLSEIAKDTVDGNTALEESGYGFLTVIVVLSAFADFSRIDHRVLAAVMTNSFAAMSHKDEFRDEFLGTMNSSTFLKR